MIRRSRLAGGLRDAPIDCSQRLMYAYQPVDRAILRTKYIATHGGFQSSICRLQSLSCRWRHVDMWTRVFQYISLDFLFSDRRGAVCWTNFPEAMCGSPLTRTKDR